MNQVLHLMQKNTEKRFCIILIYTYSITTDRAAGCDDCTNAKTSKIPKHRRNSNNNVNRLDGKFIKWLLPYFASHRNTICAPRCAHRHSTSPIFTINLPILFWNQEKDFCCVSDFFDSLSRCRLRYLSVDIRPIAALYPVQTLRISASVRKSPKEKDETSKLPITWESRSVSFAVHAELKVALKLAL